MRKNKVFVLAGASILAMSQLTGCSSVTDTLKDRFIVEEETIPVETTPAFGYEEVKETEAVVEETEEVKDIRPKDTTGNLNTIMNSLGIVTKLGKTEEENIVFNMKDSLDKYVKDDKLIVIYEEEVYPEEEAGVENTKNKNSKSSKKEEEIEISEEPKEPVEVEVINHEIGNDNSILNEIENELKSLGYTLVLASATQQFNDFDYETFVGDFTFDLEDIRANLGYNTSDIGAVLTKINNLISDKTKYVNIILNYSLQGEANTISSNNISLEIVADFNNNKILAIGYGMSNTDAELLSKFNFTSDNITWDNVISDIPTDVVYYDGLYEGSIQTYEMQREVVSEETDGEEVKESKGKESTDEETEVEMETVNKVYTISLKKFVSDEAQSFVDSEVVTKGSSDDNLLEEKIDYLGEVSINNKPIEINQILKSKDFSVAMSNMELYKAVPYKVKVFTSFNPDTEYEVSDFDSVKSIYNKYKSYGSYTRYNFEVYCTAPGDLTFVYGFKNIDGDLHYVDFKVYRGKFEKEEVVKELTDYVRLADRVVEDTDGNNSKTNSNDSDITYKFVMKSENENFVKSEIDKELGIKYTTDKLSVSDISVESLIDGLEKVDNLYVGNGQKYTVEIEVDSNSEIISYSLGRYWK